MFKIREEGGRIYEKLRNYLRVCFVLNTVVYCLADFLTVHMELQIMKQDVSFHDIMYHYRHQPQASSRVYRRVLLDPSASPATVASDDGASRDSTTSATAAPTTGKLRSGSTLPVPGLGSAPPTPEPKEHDYADLIKYYNRVFVSRVEDFVKKLQPPPGDSKEVLLASEGRDVFSTRFRCRIRRFRCRRSRPSVRTLFRHDATLPTM